MEATRPAASVRKPEALPGLTGLRGVAAVVAMLAHFGIGNVAPPFGVFLWHNAAVDVFFVLSCFTLCHVYAVPAGPVR